MLLLMVSIQPVPQPILHFLRPEDDFIMSCFKKEVYDLLEKEMVIVTATGGLIAKV